MLECKTVRFYKVNGDRVVETASGKSVVSY